ncbi:MAG: DUF6152 family protein [Steroidobacteraceae bacterium]
MKPFRMSAWGALSLGLACAGVMPAIAHHSFAVFFDADSNVMVSGIVQEFQFRNPHGLIRITVTGKEGEETWKAETNSPSILERRGWKRDSLKVGDSIIIEGWPARDGSHYLRVRAVRRADGTPIGVPLAEAAGEQR